MELVTGKYPWDCSTACAAMAFDKTLEEMEELIGHDGGEIFFPGDQEPECRRGVTMSEIIDVGLRVGYGLIRMDVNPIAQHTEKSTRYIYEDEDTRIEWIHSLGLPTIWIGPFNSLSQSWHHIVWDPVTTDYFDPRGFRIRKPNIELITGWLVVNVGDLPDPSLGTIERTEIGRNRVRSGEPSGD